jgi:hypothetical protein
MTALVLAALVGGADLATGGFRSAPAPGGGQRFEEAARVGVAAPCTVAAPRTAAGWQRAFAALDGPGWAGGDQASSVALPDGRILWLFGDTLRRGARGMEMVHNSMVIADGGCLRPVLAATEIFPDAADGTWFWPQHAAVRGDRLHVFVSRVRRAGGGPFGFTLDGTEIAEFGLASGRDPVLLRRVRTPSTGHGEDRPQWGAAIAMHGATTYVYGTARVDRPLVFGKALYVARVATSALADRRAWRYWDGHGWSPAPGAAAVIHPAVDGVSTSLSVDRLPDGRWLAVTKKNEFLGTDVVALTGPGPAGPWTETTLAAAPSYTEPGRLAYTALAHPEVALAGNRLLVTVCRNDESLAAVYADPGRYKPRFLEVAVPR